MIMIKITTTTIIIIIIVVVVVVVVVVVAMTLYKNQLKTQLVSIFYYYLICHGNEWAFSKEEKKLFSIS